MAGFVILFFILNSSNSVIADNISFDNAEIICTSWLETIISQQGNWNEQENPSIKSSTKLYNKNLLVGYIFHIDPSGYVIIPSINELSPIKSWSETGSFQKIEEYVIENLYQRVNLSLELTKEQKLAAFPKANTNYLLHSQFLYGKLELMKKVDQNYKKFPGSLKELCNKIIYVKSKTHEEITEEIRAYIN